MLTERIAIIILLCVIFTKAEEVSFSQDITSGSGTVFEQKCCEIGDHPFYSLDNAVLNIANDTVLKIIASNVVLNSKVSLKYLENVLIIGHATPTVSCNSIGTIMLSSCNNVAIKGINWENCGSRNKSFYPGGISFYNSSIITSQHCTFSSSMGLC